MNVLSEKKNHYYSEQADIIPNRSILACMEFAIIVLLASWILTEAGAFRVGKMSMRIGAGTAALFLFIPQFFNSEKYLSKPFTKYVFLTCTAVVMFIVTTLLMFHTTMCLILPMLAATFYRTPKMAYLSVIYSLFITILSPVVSFVNGLWDSLFLQVLLQFCGIESCEAVMPFFTQSQSVVQIIFYIVVPRVMIVGIFGIGTVRIVKANAKALEDRMSLLSSNEKIIAMQEDTLDCLARIIESRDGNTGTHGDKTKTYMKIFADSLIESGEFCDEVDEEKAEQIVRTSVLHDIGKVAIPDAVLNKPGKLTEEEYELMKTHCVEGERYLTTAFADNPDKLFVRTAHEVVAYHHEKLDGSGYPYGLAGENIPIAARMMAIVDAFDAITSKRVYKDAKSAEEAIAILRKDSGTHFDGRLVEIFVSAYIKKFG